MKTDDISVFISEDPEISRRIIDQFFSNDKVTYAALFKPSSRAKITTALDAIQEDDL